MESLGESIDKDWQTAMRVIMKEMWAVAYRYGSLGHDLKITCGIDVRSQLREDLGGE